MTAISKDQGTSEVQEFCVASARQAAEAGDVEGWIARFLASPGSDNAPLAHELTSTPRRWVGPIELRFDDLHRLAGPPDQPTLDRFDGDDLETVEEMGDSLDEGWDPPPIIVTFRDPQLIVEDGNHRIEGLRRNGRDRWWALVACKDEHEQQAVERRAAPSGEQR